MNRFGLATAAAMTLGLAAAQPAAAETLYDALAAAYANNPTLQAERARLRGVDEGVPQALSGWRPTVTIGADLGVQRQEINNAGAANDTPKSGQIAVSQPLYRGGRTIAQTDSAEASVLAGRERLRGVEQQVLFSAVSAYMDVLRDQAVVELNRNNEQVLGRQLEAARDRFRVGEITRTDVAQAEARLSRASADRVQAEGVLISSRATYERVVGRVPGDLLPPPPLPPLPGNEQEVVGAAQVENPDLLSARHSEAGALADVRVANGALLPTVSLAASHTRGADLSSTINESDTTKVVASVSVPLYQAGSVESKVRQAKQAHSERRIRIDETMRLVVERATQAWENLNTARARITSRREQVRATEIALDGVQQEAAVGARTTLDILDAEQELLDARVALVQAERDEYVSAFAVQSAIGRLTAERLNLAGDRYDPTSYYSRVRDKWYGTGAE